MTDKTQLELIEGTLRIMLDHMDDVLGECDSYSHDLTHIGAGVFRAGFYSHTLYMIGPDGKLLVWYDTFDFEGMNTYPVHVFEDVDAFVTEQTKIIQEMMAA